MPMSCACQTDSSGHVTGPCGAHSDMLREYTKYRNERVAKAIDEARQMATKALFEGKEERAAGMAAVVNHLERKQLTGD